MERWNPDSGCVKRKNQLGRVWVRIVVGLPLHLWTCDVLRMIGDECGGYLAIDEEKMHRTEVLLWARILVKAEGKERPNTVNILSGSRSYELQIWWELPPWVVGVFPAKGEDCSKQNREEDVWGSRVGQGACSRKKHAASSLVELTKTTAREALGREVATVLRMGHDLSGKGSRSLGLGPTGGRIRLVSGLEEESDGLSPSGCQLKHKIRGKLNA